MLDFIELSWPLFLNTNNDEFTSKVNADLSFSNFTFEGFLLFLEQALRELKNNRPTTAITYLDK